MDKLKVAMIGCGRISDVYKGVFKELNDQAEVVYAVDPDTEKAKKFSKDFKTCTVLSDYREVLQSDIDIAHITTPHHLHAQMAIDFLQNGHHVLVEKPMATSIEDAKKMIDASKKSGAKLGVIFQNRYVKGCRELKKMIDRGDLGKILGARSFLAWSRPEVYYSEADWKGTWEMEGGSTLINQAIHSLDRVVWLVGSDIKWIEGSVANRLTGNIETEDTAEAMVEFENGCLYHLHASNNYPINAPTEVEIVGEKGRVGLLDDIAWVHIDGKEGYEIEDDSIGEQIGPSYWGRAHLLQVKDFYDSVMEDREVAVDGEEGLKTLELVLSIYKSARENKRVFLNRGIGGE